MHSYHLYTLPLLLLFTSKILWADDQNENTISPWVIRKIESSDKLFSSGNLNLCPQVNKLSSESCTVWEMFHKNDIAKEYPFYFSRTNDSHDPYAEICVTRKIIKDIMIDVTNNALDISKDNENGVLFSTGHSRSECMTTVVCNDGIHCNQGGQFNIQVAYSGFLPLGQGGCREVINAVQPLMQICERESNIHTVGARLLTAICSVGLVLEAGVAVYILGIWMVALDRYRTAPYGSNKTCWICYLKYNDVNQGA